MFWQLKKEKIKLSVPTLSMQYVVVLLFKLPVGNNKHPNFEWRGGRGGGVWTVLFSEVTPFEDKVSTILSLIVHQQAKQYLNNLKCNNCMMLSYCGFHCFTPPHNIVIRIMFHYFLQKWSCLSWRILLCSNMDVTTIFFILSGCLENQP